MHPNTRRGEKENTRRARGMRLKGWGIGRIPSAKYRIRTDDTRFRRAVLYPLS